MDKQLESIKHILTSANEIAKKDNEEKQKMFLQGDSFCIFSVLGMEHDEVHNHSAFISELLNPHGSHGQGDFFLRSFLKTIESPMEFDHPTVKCEFFIGFINKSKTEGGRLDILIEDKNNIVVIENKIDAGDQKNQLLRYYDYCAKQSKRFEIYYLTKDGHAPSVYSTGNKDFEYWTISYKDDIVTWLHECIPQLAKSPKLKYSIEQYIANLHNILHTMNSESEKDMVNLLTAKENIQGSLAILSHRTEVEIGVRKLFIEQCKELADKHGIKCTVDEGFEYYEPKQEKYIHFYKPRFTNWLIKLGYEDTTKRNGGLNIFVAPESNEILTSATKKNLRSFIKSEECFLIGEKADVNWPNGWTYILGPNNEPWWNLNDLGTLEDIINGKVINRIEQLISDILSHKQLEELTKLTDYK